MGFIRLIRSVETAHCRLVLVANFCTAKVLIQVHELVWEGERNLYSFSVKLVDFISFLGSIETRMRNWGMSLLINFYCFH